MKKGILLLVATMLCCMVTGCNMGKEEQTQTLNSMEESGDIAESTTENYIEESEQILIKEAIEQEFEADLTHDQNKEIVRLEIEPTDMPMLPSIKISVWNGENMIYEKEVYLHYTHGEQLYLVSYEGKDYLMRYRPFVGHNHATCEYEIFSLNQQGEKEVLDSKNIEIYLFDVEKIDKNAWIDFAEKENQYFKNAFLIVGTSNAELKYSTPEKKEMYTENYHWLINGTKENESLEQNLDKFILETKENYQRN